MSGSRSGEGKPPAASRPRSSALPRLYVRPNGADHQWKDDPSIERDEGVYAATAPLIRALPLFWIDRKNWQASSNLGWRRPAACLLHTYRRFCSASDKDQHV